MDPPSWGRLPPVSALTSRILEDLQESQAFRGGQVGVHPADPCPGDLEAETVWQARRISGRPSFHPVCPTRWGLLPKCAEIAIT